MTTQNQQERIGFDPTDPFGAEGKYGFRPQMGNGITDRFTAHHQPFKPVADVAVGYALGRAVRGTGLGRILFIGCALLIAVVVIGLVVMAVTSPTSQSLPVPPTN